MCGITGIYNVKGAPIDPALIEKMAHSIRHRGPDDQGIYIDNNVALAHQRLSIIDLTVAGHQPMTNHNGNLFIIFNGEIYNFKEIRRELELLGHRFSSKTDTEVIICAHEEWGERALEKINGMFAFAIFNKDSKELFIARDRLGEKPLYYYFDNEIFAFASEIKAILQNPNIKINLSSQGMANYFMFGNSIAPDTIYQGVKKLLPGHCLLLKNGQINIKEYWSLRVNDNEKDEGEEYYKEGVRNLFENSVKERLISDVPLGVFLSGGIDSSAVVAMMSNLGVNPIKTFSVGFNIKGLEFNELSDAKIVADYFHTDHHEIILTEDDVLKNLEKMIYHFDEPFADAANLPIFCMSQFAKNYVSVVLTGDGSDEIFGGYRRYVVEKNRSKLLFLNSILKNKSFSSIIKRLPHLRKTKKFVNALSIKDDIVRYTNWISFFSSEMINNLFSENALENADPLKMHKKYFQEIAQKPWLEQIMYLDQKILLPDRYLEKVDKASMAYALETRPPILDYHLVEFANAIPPKYKIRGLKTKYIFKEAMSELLPGQIIKKKKHGFSVPTNIWFRGKLKEYLFSVIFDQKTKSRGYFNYDYIENLYKSYEKGNQPFDSQFWALLNFELWHREFIDNQLIKQA